MLPQIDLDGQEKLLAGHVLLIGAGGLGSPASLYLASAGVGRLTICDGDIVDLTNLQRQIVHRENTIGVNKAESARRALAEINPDCKVTAIQERVDQSTLLELVRNADVVVDACDNFATRYAVNNACVKLRKPLVSGAAIRFAGQLAVFDMRQDHSPCYHCLFPQTVSEEVESCALMGVFAPLTGMIGSLQAGEAIRILAGKPSPLAGHLVIFDANGLEWQKVKLTRDANCLVCSTR
jgi:adenylyltransferase/sulfurtransferase